MPGNELLESEEDTAAVLLSRLQSPGRGTEDEQAQGRGTVFVFPSEIIADHWRRKILRLSGRGAIRGDTFLSWDRFKESVFRLHREETPVNSVMRTLFAASFLERNRLAAEEGTRTPLRYLIPPEHAQHGAGFVRFVTAMLPRLGTFRNHLRDRGTELEPEIPADISNEIRASVSENGQLDLQIDTPSEGETRWEPFIRDIRGLHFEYEEFLRDTGLFEPTDEVPALGGLDRRYLIFFPQVIEDFPEFAPLLTRSPDISCFGNLSSNSHSNRLYDDEGDVVAAGGEAGKEYGGGSEGESDKSLRVFPNSRMESEYLLGRIAALLASGVDPAEIAVTACEYDAWVPVLEDSARYYGVRLEFRRGDPLTTFPAGRIFRRIADCAAEEFSHGAMKALLLDRAVPWRNRDSLRALLRFGTANGCLRNYPRSGLGGRAESSRGDDGAATSSIADIWERHLTRLGQPDLGGVYRGIRSAILGLSNADSFAQLESAVQRFVNIHLDTASMNPSDLLVFQACLDLLRDCVRAETAAPRLVPHRPLQLWLSLLDSRVYVAAHGDGGIPVYPYRVAAGLSPAYHFVVGASQEAVSIHSDPFPFLSDEMRMRIDAEPRDLTIAFLDLYRTSGRCVEISCSRETAEGPRLPPGYFFTAGGIDEIGTRLGESCGDAPGRAVFADPRHREERYWSGEERKLMPAPEGMPTVLTDGFRHAVRTVLSDGGFDMTLQPLPEIPAGIVRDALRGKNVRIKVSPTALDVFTGCGFEYLLRWGFLLRDPEYEVVLSDPRQVGIMMHAVLRAYYESDENGSSEQPDAGMEETIRERIRVCTRRIFEGYERSKPVFLEPEWDAAERSIVELLSVVALRDARTFAEYKTVALEREDAMDHGAEFSLSGKADRVSSNGEYLALLDYKKRGYPSAGAMRPDEEGRIGASQLPFYLYLLERSAEFESQRVGAAAYCSIENEGKYRFAYLDPEAGIRDSSKTPPAYPVDGLGEAFSALEKSIESMEAAVLQGDYRTPPPWEGCESCDLRPVCRKRFVVG